MSVGATAQTLELPSLDAPDEASPQPVRKLGKLPVLAEPEMKILTDREKKVIDNVVDSLFKSESESKKTADDNIDNSDEPKAVTVNIGTDDGEEITVTVEKELGSDQNDDVANAPVDAKEAEVPLKSILDSKREVASKNDKGIKKEKLAEETVLAPKSEEKSEDIIPNKGKEIELEANKVATEDGQGNNDNKKKEKIFDTGKMIVGSSDKEKSDIARNDSNDVNDDINKEEEDKKAPDNNKVKTDSSIDAKDVNKVDYGKYLDDNIESLKRDGLVKSHNFADVKLLRKPEYVESNNGFNNYGDRQVEFRKKSVISINNDDFDVSSYNDGSLYKSLNRITKLPSRVKKLEVKQDIVINRGEFKDPFYDEVEEADLSTASGSVDKDFQGIDLSSIEKPLDINELKTSPKKTRAKKKAKRFHIREKDLVVSVKSIDKNSRKYIKNAKDALAMGQYESAIAYYKELVKKNPKDRKFLFGLATSYHRAKQYEKAKDAYLKVINKYRNYWPAVNNYIILVSEENPKDAIDKLNDLWTNNPSFAAIPAYMGNLFFKQGNYRNSIDYYSKAISLDPENYNYQYNLAVILERVGERSSAAKIYLNILQNADASNLPESRINLEKRYYKLVSNR